MLCVYFILLHIYIYDFLYYINVFTNTSSLFFSAFPKKKHQESHSKAQLSRASCPGVGAEMEIRRREGLGKDHRGRPTGRVGARCGLSWRKNERDVSFSIGIYRNKRRRLVDLCVICDESR